MFTFKTTGIRMTTVSSPSSFYTNKKTISLLFLCLMHFQGSHSLEKSLNFKGSPCKVLEFSSTLNVVVWKEFF